MFIEAGIKRARNRTDNRGERNISLAAVIGVNAFRTTLTSSDSIGLLNWSRKDEDFYDPVNTPGRVSRATSTGTNSDKPRRNNNRPERFLPLLFFLDRALGRYAIGVPEYESRIDWPRIAYLPRREDRSQRAPTLLLVRSARSWPIDRYPYPAGSRFGIVRHSYKELLLKINGQPQDPAPGKNNFDYVYTDRLTDYLGSLERGERASLELAGKHSALKRIRCPGSRFTLRVVLHRALHRWIVVAFSRILRLPSFHRPTGDSRLLADFDEVFIPAQFTYPLVI